jgi:hypothetical protein
MIRRSVLVAVALLLAPVAARAQVAPAPARIDRPGFDLGLRVGYALPMGEFREGADFSDGVSGQIPLQVDALYRVNSQYAFGVYAGYGFAFVKDPVCDEYGVSCSGEVIRVGVEGLIHFSVPGTFVPWVGAGIGYEWLKIKASAGGNSETLSARGFEILNLQGGGDWVASPDFTVGPFVSLSIGQYRSTEAFGMSADIDNKGIHEWLQLGVKGTFSL